MIFSVFRDTDDSPKDKAEHYCSRTNICSMEVLSKSGKRVVPGPMRSHAAMFPICKLLVNGQL